MCGFCRDNEGKGVIVVLWRITRGIACHYNQPEYISFMAWEVVIKKKVARDVKKLPKGVRENLFFLIGDIELTGPVRGNWPNYGKLGRNRHHCHLKKGKPTYVAVWEVSERQVKLVEVIYAGTHEKAPY